MGLIVAPVCLACMGELPHHPEVDPAPMSPGGPGQAWHILRPHNPHLHQLQGGPWESLHHVAESLCVSEENANSEHIWSTLC